MEQVSRRRPDFPLIWTFAAGTAGLAASLFSRSTDRGRKEVTAAARPRADGNSSVTEGNGVAPTDVPPTSWWSIVWRSVKRVKSDRILSFAAAVTFYMLLAIFPGIAVLVSLYGFVADPDTVATIIQAMHGVFPEGAVSILADQTERLAGQTSGALGAAFATGLLLSVWSANGGTKAVFDALNVAYGEEEKRSFVKLNAISLAFTFATILFAMVALGAMVVLPPVLQALGFAAPYRLLVDWGKWPILLLVVAIYLSALYRFGPSRENPRWAPLTWGGSLAAVLWLGASILFSWYAANFGSYNRTYGSLGAIVGFMTWVWLSSSIVLVGALINAELEREASATGRSERA